VGFLAGGDRRVADGAALLRVLGEGSANGLRAVQGLACVGHFGAAAA